MCININENGVGEVLFSEDLIVNRSYPSVPSERNPDHFLGVPTLNDVVELVEVDDDSYQPLPSTIKNNDVIISDFVKELNTAYQLSLWFNNIPQIRLELKQLCKLTSLVHTVTEGIYDQEMLVTFTIPKSDKNDLLNLINTLREKDLFWNNLHLF